MQIVHLPVGESDMSGAVISIFFDTNRPSNGMSRNPHPNAFIDSLKFDSATSEGYSLDEVNLATFLAGVDMRQYWAYNGSRATPPCTEGYKWVVIE